MLCELTLARFEHKLLRVTYEVLTTPKRHTFIPSSVCSLPAALALHLLSLSLVHQHHHRSFRYAAPYLFYPLLSVNLIPSLSVFLSLSFSSLFLTRHLIPSFRTVCLGLNSKFIPVMPPLSSEEQ